MVCSCFAVYVMANNTWIVPCLEWLVAIHGGDLRPVLRFTTTIASMFVLYLIAFLIVSLNIAIFFLNARFC